MPVRSSMADLITRTRRFIGDPVSATQHFADTDIQDALDDGHQFVVRYAPLRPGPTLQPGGLYDFLDYYSDVGNWESDEQLTWVDFSVITPTTSDRIAGHWVVPQQTPVGVYPPLYITGKFYDLHGAAADLLEQWAASLATTTYNFSADGASFSRGKIVDSLMALANTHRAKQMATSHRVRRTDVAGAMGETGVFPLDAGGPGRLS